MFQDIMFSDKVKKRSIDSIVPTDNLPMQEPEIQNGAGGQINVIQAVIDDVPTKIKSITKEINSLDKKREQLEVERRAYEDMLAIAYRYEEQRRNLLLNMNQ